MNCPWSRFEQHAGTKHAADELDEGLTKVRILMMSLFLYIAKMSQLSDSADPIIDEGLTKNTILTEMLYGENSVNL